MVWKKLITQTCFSFSSNSNANPNPPPPLKKSNSSSSSNNVGGGGACAICLEALNWKSSAIFMAQCGHAFHLSCISCNVGHGSVTCPICRAHWTQLPRKSQSLPADLVLVATPTGLHMKQAMALVILSMRPQDRLSILTHSALVFPLTRMTSYAKQTALQLIHRFHIHTTTSAHPKLGLAKGIQVLRHRLYRNPKSLILHLSHNPQSYSELQGLHCYHVCHWFATHQFQDFLTGMLGRAVTGMHLNIQEKEVLPKSGQMLIGVQSHTHYEGIWQQFHG